MSRLKCRCCSEDAFTSWYANDGVFMGYVCKEHHAIMDVDKAFDKWDYVFIDKSCKEPEEIAAQKLCSCSMTEIMRFGCKCGGK